MVESSNALTSPCSQCLEEGAAPSESQAGGSVLGSDASDCQHPLVRADLGNRIFVGGEEGDAMPTIAVRIGNLKAHALVDMGAGVSLITEKSFQTALGRRYRRDQLRPGAVPHCFDGAGQKMPLLGAINLDVTIGVKPRIVNRSMSPLKACILFSWVRTSTNSLMVSITHFQMTGGSCGDVISGDAC